MVRKNFRKKIKSEQLQPILVGILVRNYQNKRSLNVFTKILKFNLSPVIQVFGKHLGGGIINADVTKFNMLFKQEAYIFQDW